MFKLFVSVNGDCISAGTTSTIAEAKQLLRHFQRFGNVCTAVVRFSHAENVAYALAEISRECL